MLLKFADLCVLLKADESIVLGLIEGGYLPPPVNIGHRLIRWVEADLTKWVQTGCPSFPAPTAEEIELIRVNCAEERGDGDRPQLPAPQPCSGAPS